MEQSFWLEKWRRHEIGFHEDEPNGYLRRYWPKLELGPKTTVLVPLCGKSPDLMWLRERGHRVIGVELSPLAVEAFFAERGLKVEREPAGALSCYRSGELEILQGDIFALEPEQLPVIDAVYDRAALIALPASQRRRYAAHLRTLCPALREMLLIALDYAPGDEGKPPFSVSGNEITQLYRDWLQVQVLQRDSVLLENPSLAQRGLTALYETVYRLR